VKRTGIGALHAPYDRSLTVIGDPDQAIYSFRGASSQNFVGFERSFPGTRVVRLTQCYRSSPLILSAAGEVIRRNPGRVDHRLESLAAPGPNVQVERTESEEDEAKFVVGEIRRLMGGLDRQDFDTKAVAGHDPDEQLSFADFAVLYRLHAVGAALVEEFARSGIPFQQIGAPLLREQVETRTLMAALRFLANPEDRLSRERISSNSMRGPTAFVVEQLRSECTIESPARAVLERLRGQLECNADMDCQSALMRLIAHATAGDESLGEFLRRLDLERYEDSHDPRADKVTLMTLHAAKGLEFGVVFLVGCEAGVLPYLRPDPSPPTPLPADGARGGSQSRAEQGAEIEEERRLFYVGMTRARRRLVLTWAASRFLFGQRTTNQPSPFLSEIPESLVGGATEVKPHGLRRARRRGPRQRRLFLK
jgi:superfamily I DNA/RNA helicase